MTQVSRFRTLEDKLMVPLTGAGAMDEGADTGQQMNLV